MRDQCRIVAIGLGIGLGLFGPVCVRADDGVRARLVLSRAAGAERCNDAADLRGAVASRMGFDPFDDVSDVTAEVSLTRSGRAMLATIRLVDREGHVLGARDLRTIGAPRCDELDELVALTLALAIDSIGFSVPPPAERTVPPAESSDPPQVNVEAERTTSDSATAWTREDEAEIPVSSGVVVELPSTPPAVEAPHEPLGDARQPAWSFGGYAFGGVDFGHGPGPSVLGGVGAVARLGWASIELEGRVASAHALRPSNLPGERVDLRYYGGVLALCGSVRFVSLCWLTAAGATRGASVGIATPRSDVAPVIDQALSLRGEWRPRSRLRVFVRGDFGVAVLRARARIDDQSVFVAGRANGFLSVGAAFERP